MSIFSTYSTGENRVTASILAVLRSLSLQRIERLLGALLEESELQLLQFTNQPSKHGPGVPDGEICGSFHLLIETKIKHRAVKSDQLVRHLQHLDKSTSQTSRLLVLTPDANVPKAVSELEDERLAWASFGTLDQAVDELLADSREVVSEREAFLLRELQAMLLAEKLLGSEKDVVVVPARRAWPGYLRWKAYICQPGRPFQPVERIAFYHDSAIQTRVPKILETHDHVLLKPGLHSSVLGQLVEAMLADAKERQRYGTEQKVFLLSDPEAPETMRLEKPIINDLTSKSGRTVAFTQNQRYVTSAQLQTAKHTSELV